MSRIMQNMKVMFRIIKTNWGKCPGSYKVLGKCPGSYKIWYECPGSCNNSREAHNSLRSEPAVDG